MNLLNVMKLLSKANATVYASEGVDKELNIL
jgi:hypothetical protein